jgi:non-specific serine/threonine protein kinase
MHPTVLSSKLNGTGASLSNPETKKIIQTLAEWDGITTRAEAVELLTLLNLKASLFSAEEWDSPPLSRLEKGSAPSPGLAFSPTGDIPGTPQHNLPNPATPLVGRAREVEVVSNLLRQTDARLVTLTGPGGTGKTRLAIQIGKSLLGHFSGGVFLVSLAPITDPALVPSAIARALGVREAGSRALEDTLKDVLRDRHLLLILDNFEQVTPAASHIGDLLAAAPDLKVLVTSRALLRLYGEYEFVVPPLALPDRTPGALLSPPDMLKFPAVSLFVQRARAAKASFELTPANAPAVAEICARLDGLPLAMELAAARVKLFSPQAMLSRLGSRLTLLTGGARDLDPRHQTLRSAIDWSYNLLDADEQALFASISVFAGGCTLEAAEAVARGQGSRIRDQEPEAEAQTSPAHKSLTPGPWPLTPILDKLASLVDKSMLRQEEDESGEPRIEPRIMMLETIREYALEQLAASGQEGEIRCRHLLYFTEYAEAAQKHLRGPEQAIWMARLERDHDNLRAALTWACREEDEGGDAALALRLVAALWFFWYGHGHMSEGRAWLNRVLALDLASTDPAMRAGVMNAAGILAGQQSDYGEAMSWTEQALNLRRELADTQGVANALNNLGELAHHTGDYERASGLLAEALELQRELGNRRGVAFALGNLALLAQSMGDYDRGITLIAETVEITRELGHWAGLANALDAMGYMETQRGNITEAESLLRRGMEHWRELGDKAGIAITTGHLGQVALARGDLAEAESLLQESLTLHHDLHDRRNIANNLQALAALALKRGDAERSVSLHSAVEALYHQIGAPIPLNQKMQQSRDLETARLSLPPDTWETAWAAGQKLTPGEAVQLGLTSGPLTVSIKRLA